MADEEEKARVKRKWLEIIPARRPAAPRSPVTASQRRFEEDPNKSVPVRAKVNGFPRMLRQTFIMTPGSAITITIYDHENQAIIND